MRTRTPALPLIPFHPTRPLSNLDSAGIRRWMLFHRKTTAAILGGLETLTCHRRCYRRGDGDGIVVGWQLYRNLLALWLEYSRRGVISRDLFVWTVGCQDVYVLWGLVSSAVCLVRVERKGKLWRHRIMSSQTSCTQRKIVSTLL
jgi:hypothetical protein